MTFSKGDIVAYSKANNRKYYIAGVGPGDSIKISGQGIYWTEEWLASSKFLTLIKKASPVTLAILKIKGY